MTSMRFAAEFEDDAHRAEIRCPAGMLQGNNIWVCGRSDSEVVVENGMSPMITVSDAAAPAAMSRSEFAVCEFVFACNPGQTTSAPNG
jgi:hypothetical protein